METIQGNKLISEFMNIPKCDRCKECDCVKMGAAYYTPADMEYHTSWDWQIKVWCKLAHEVKAWLVGRSEHDIQKYFRWVSKYEEAVFNDQPEKGYEVIIEMLEWYNTQKPVNQHP